MTTLSHPNQSIGRGALWNLLGTVAALSIAVLVLAPLTQLLGTERFGVLMLVWAAVGYFGFLDFGVGRALAREIAEIRARPGRKDPRPVALTGLVTLLVLGLAIGAGLGIVSAWLTRDVFTLSVTLQAEAERSFQLVSFAIPAIFVSGGMRGVLEAYRRFAVVSVLRNGAMAAIGLGAVAAASFSADLVTVAFVIVIARWLESAIYARLCMREFGGLYRLTRPAVLKTLFAQGGWMTISNVIGPLMVYFDRFVIAALLSAAAVAYYVVPYEVVTKLWVVPGALTAVLFPVFSGAGWTDTARVSVLLVRAMNICFLVIGPVVLLFVSMAAPALDLWLGAEFADQGTIVLQVLAVGVFVSCLAQIPFTLLQAVGRSDITGKLHLAEAVPYLAFLWISVGHFGTKGAAIAWTARVVVDAAALWAIAFKKFDAARRGLGDIAKYAVIAIGVFAVVALPIATEVALVVGTLGVVAFAAAAWMLVLSSADRAAVTALLR